MKCNYLSLSLIPVVGTTFLNWKVTAYIKHQINKYLYILISCIYIKLIMKITYNQDAVSLHSPMITMSPYWSILTGNCIQHDIRYALCIHKKVFCAITGPNCIKFQKHQLMVDLYALFGLSPSTAVIVQPATIPLLIRKLFLYLYQTSSPDQPPLIEANRTRHHPTDEIGIQFQIPFKYIYQ